MIICFINMADNVTDCFSQQEDYIITEDDVFAPLRWLAPELVGERHGGVITMEQTKPSNVW